MHTYIATFLSIAVALGLFLQVATVTRVGGRIARARLARWRSRAARPAKVTGRSAGAPTPAPRARRRYRDYRLALHSVRASK